MRRRPVSQLRLGRALLVAATFAVVVVAVSSAAGLGLTGGFSHSASPVSFADQYVVAPAISSFSPASGTVGTSITITGTGFTGATAVTINGHAASSFTVDSDTQITAVVASGTGSTGHIVVTNSAGTATSAGTFTFGAQIVSFSPTNGLPGTAVTISGLNFGTGPSSLLGVSFNGKPASGFTWISSTQVSAIVASGTTSGPITVTTSTNTATSSSDFTVVSTPSVDSFSPESGGVGSTVTITGNNFIGATAVKFNTTSTSAFSVNGDGTQITVNIPVGATTGKISVVTPAGTGVSSSSFTILALPTVGSFVPTSGVSAPTATTVTINGSNFNNVSAVRFNGVSASFTPGTATRLTATVPVGATTGHISVTTQAGTATSGGNFTVYQVPTIPTFTPTTQQPGGKVTLFGTGFTGTTSVKLNTTTAPFVFNSDTQLTVTVPTALALGSYTIHVTNPAGTGHSADSLTVGTLTAPHIDSFSPAEGPANTQFTTTVTIHGTSFLGVTSVLFNGKPSTDVTVDTTTPSDNVITAVAPVGATTGKISVVNAKGTTLTASNFVVDQPPRVISISPTSGVADTTLVTISGANLTGAGTTSVTFGGVAATPTLLTATQIKAVVPHTAVTGPITVTDSGIGSSSSATFSVIQAPTITGLDPSVGRAGTVVTVSGTNFLGGAAPVVKFDGTPGTGVRVLSDTSLTVVAPAKPLATVAHLTITNAAGTSDPSTDTFTYGGAPSNVAFTPLHGPANTFNTTLVSITGNNFDEASKVMFGAKPAAAFSVVDPGHISAIAPIGATSGKISVTTPTGTGISAATFVVDPLPTVTSFTPAPPLGADPGGTVIIRGANFILTTGSQVDGVSFNGTAAASFHVDSATQITAVLPGSGVTTGPITVTNSAVGSATSAASLIIKVAPTLSSFSPASGIPGTRVTLTGSGFSGGGVTVRFDGDGSGAKNGLAVVVANDSTLAVTVPPLATTGTITVTNSQDSATSDDEFIVAVRPTIASFDPASGPASAQATTVVDIQGTHLNGTTKVMFNGKQSPFVAVNDDTDITALVPVGATSGKITIVNPAGTAVSAGSFTVDGAPVVTSISPTVGAVGDTVTITGKNFIGEMGGDTFASDTWVDTHGFFNATIDSISSTQIVVEVPNGTTTGPFLVGNVWGETAVTPQFTIVDPPAIDDFMNEFTGLQSGKKGAPVLIIGSGFTGTTSVRFNGTSASFAVIADWEIIATVPRGATTGPITVTNPADTGTTAPDNFTILP